MPSLASELMPWKLNRCGAVSCAAQMHGIEANLSRYGASVSNWAEDGALTEVNEVEAVTREIKFAVRNLDGSPALHPQTL